MTQGKPSKEGSSQDKRGIPDVQTPAIKHPGQYTADDLKQQEQSPESDQSESVEGSPNQGTESR